MSMSKLLERYPELMAQCLNLSGTTILFITDEDYNITFCTDSLTHKLHILSKPIGAHLATVLCPLEEEGFSLIVSNGSKKFLPQLFRLCDSHDLYRCYTFPIDEGYFIWADKVGSTENEILESMSHLNNELTEMSRELSKKNRELHRANEKITRFSRTDFLTELSNRSYFQERFTETFSLTKRHGLQLTLLLADLDHFKRINDTYGHDVGDNVLQTFGSILERCCRAEDLPARYGGEEFMVMLPNTSAAGSVALHERLREELVHSNLLSGADYVTFSAGIVEYWKGCTELSLLKKTDDALYAAKNNGRDRYCIFP